MGGLLGGGPKGMLAPSQIIGGELPPCPPLPTPMILNDIVIKRRWFRKSTGQTLKEELNCRPMPVLLFLQVHIFTLKIFKSLKSCITYICIGSYRTK